VPQLQREQRQNFSGVATGFFVRSDHCFHGGLLEVPASRSCAIEQNAVYVVSQIGAQPLAKWNREAGFPALDNWARNAVIQRSLGDVLCRKAVNFEVSGREAANSITLWSRKGTRSSMEFAMVILSALSNRSSGSDVFVSI